MVLAYHVIFGAYGFWLPNDPRGSWSDFVGAWELLRFGKATKTTERRSVAPCRTIGDCVKKPSGREISAGGVFRPASVGGREGFDQRARKAITSSTPARFCQNTYTW